MDDKGNDPGARIRKHQGSLIRQLRTSREMTVKDLADAITAIGADRGISYLAVTPAAVQQWENERTSPRQVTQLAVALVLDVPWLTIFSLESVTL